MQQLHLVGFTTDHKGLILGTRRGTNEGSYVVTLDQGFVEQIEELLRLQAGEGVAGDAARVAAGNGAAPLLRRPKVESRLTPREVQALLRTGRSVSEVAETAGMSEAWVERFAPPVLAEQARVIERATGLTYSKPRIGPSLQPLGESVIWNLAERGIVLTGTTAADAWSAFQQPDGGWVVRVSYLSERRRQHADWTVDMALGALKAVNRLGNELGYVEQGRRRPQALPPATPASASAQRAASAPPKLTPPPPPPPRPSGRLSLLGPGSGLSRQAASPRTPEPRSAPATPPATSPPAAPPAAPATSPPEAAPPAAEQPAPGERRPRPLRPRSATVAPDAPGDPAPTREQRPRDVPNGGGDAASPPAKPRRERPLRAPSRVRPDELAEPQRERPLRAPSRVRPDELAEPQRERPLRAPSRVRRDELAEPHETVSRRSVLPPRRNPPGQAPPAPPAEPPPAGAHRPGSAHSAERKVSTAERFGIGHSMGRAALASEVSTEEVPAVPRRALDTEPNSHAEPSVVRRIGARRPLKDQRVLADDSEPEAPRAAGSELAPEGFAAPPVSEPSVSDSASDADRGWAPPAEADDDDPITAPVPVVTFDAGDDLQTFGELGAEPLGSGDQVMIRAGQAGAAEPAERPSTGRARPGDDRQGRPGRLKLRRRPPAQ